MAGSVIGAGAGAKLGAAALGTAGAVGGSSALPGGGTLAGGIGGAFVGGVAGGMLGGAAGAGAAGLLVRKIMGRRAEVEVLRGTAAVIIDRRQRVQTPAMLRLFAMRRELRASMHKTLENL